MVSPYLWNFLKTADLSLLRRTLSKRQRTSYINAVLCLDNKPSASNKNVTGVRSRYNEFQYLHIKQTYFIHFNVCHLLLSGIRKLSWRVGSRESRLHSLRGTDGLYGHLKKPFKRSAAIEAHYRKFLSKNASLHFSKILGMLRRKPSRYWNWFLDGRNLTASPLLDGSPYSFGGDGVFVPPPPNRFAVVDLAPVIDAIWNLTTLEGTGGGCVTTGPFAGWTVPFGPIGPNLTDSIRDDLINNIKYKPHCLTRNFKPKLAAYSFTQVSLDAVLQSPNITEFNKRLSSLLNPTIPTIFNLHDKGHQGM